MTLDRPEIYQVEYDEGFSRREKLTFECPPKYSADVQAIADRKEVPTSAVYEGAFRTGLRVLLDQNEQNILFLVKQTRPIRTDLSLKTRQLIRTLDGVQESFWSEKLEEWGITLGSQDKFQFRAPEPLRHLLSEQAAEKGFYSRGILCREVMASGLVLVRSCILGGSELKMRTPDAIHDIAPL